MLTASIVIFHTPHEELVRTVGTLLAAPEVRRVFVVDHAADDEAKAFCAEVDNQRVVYERHPNRGYGAGHNVALRRVVTDEAVRYHLVLNSDVTFSPEVLTSLVRYMDSRPDVGQVIPRVTYPDGRLQYVCRLLPSPADLILRRFLPRTWCRRRRERYTLAYTGYHSEMNAPYHIGCFLMIRTEALRKVGLFDERFFMYPEDIDLTRRIHQHYRTMFFPDATIVHDHRAASYHSWRMTRIHMCNIFKYFNKWGWFCDAQRRAFNNRILSETRQRDNA